jgi:NAD(P)H-dependent flavin oxidoreductase YrpB (nitropropane dioxygenase family)
LEGQLGVVSGTAIETVLTRRLQLGDEGGHIRRSFDAFPFKDVAQRVWDRYFVEGGKAPDAPFKAKPVPTFPLSQAITDLLVLGNFTEVFLAKEGHSGLVGLNLLTKIQMPTVPSLFGAMLAGVDYVIMGAGIPRAIPAILDKLAAGHPAELDIDVSGDGQGESKLVFDPGMYGAPDLKRPDFLAIISSTLLATVLAKKAARPVDGFVIEGPTAGGHNAPPRGSGPLSDKGEPVYTERDVVDLAKLREIGLPFWLAGSYGGRLFEAQAEGAQGIQVGTPFAFCDESGMRRDLKDKVIGQSVAGTAEVFTDPKASPTGFPFKVLQDNETLSEPAIFGARERVCDLGYLREAYRKDDGSVGFRCPSEPLDHFAAKGGDLAETEGRMCVCNGLMSTVGYGQVRAGEVEAPLITAGDDVVNIKKYLKPGASRYSAKDVIEVLLRKN